MQGRNVEPAGGLLFFAAENAAGLLFFPANGPGYPSLITDPSTQHFPKVELTPLGKSTSISAQSISSVQREKHCCSSENPSVCAPPRRPGWGLFGRTFIAAHGLMISPVSTQICDISSQALHFCF